MRHLILLTIVLLLAACGTGEDTPSGSVESTPGTTQSTPRIALGATPTPTPVPRKPHRFATPVVLPAKGVDRISRGLSAVDVELGDCFPEFGEEEVYILQQISCDQPHGPEVYHLANYPAGPDAPYPGREEIYVFAEEVCVTSFEGYVGIPYVESVFQITYLEPTRTRWKDGDREVACILYSHEGPLVGSMRDSSRTTSSATPLPEPTLTSPATSTPITVPPLSVHTWQAEPVLIQLGEYGGDGGPVFLQTHMSYLLYADGRLIFERRTEAGAHLFETKLERRELCALLNTIEQVGFLDYESDPEANPVLDSWFDPEMPDIGEGGSWTGVEVNAWRSNAAGFDQLGRFVEALEGLPRAKMEQYVGEALYATYRLLDRYVWSDVRPFQPEVILLQIYPAPSGLHETGQDWPDTLPPLSQLAHDNPQTAIELSQPEARPIYTFFRDSVASNSGVFNEGDQQFVVQLRPLFPYESVAGFLNEPGQIPSADIPPIPPIELTCDPSDGTLAIP